MTFWRGYRKKFSGKENKTRAEKCGCLEFEDMVLYDSGEADPLRILALGELIHHLRFENMWFVDGTFD